MRVEYIHKEKEYGIKWRSAYKQELTKEVSKLIAKLGNPVANDANWTGDMLIVIYELVAKDYRDVLTFV